MATCQYPAGLYRWFVTDDQDQMLGSSFPQHNNVGPMPKTKALMQDKGAMALNFFIHTVRPPITCATLTDSRDCEGLTVSPVLSW